MTREVTSMDERPTLTAKGQAAQNRVVAAALELFEQQGYVATSIRQIAAAANLAKGTVYHHYATKADILYEIHNIFMETLEEGMERIEGSDEPAVDRLRMIIHELWRVMTSHRPHVQVFFEDWRYLDAEHIAGLRKRRDGYYHFVRETVAEALAAKRVTVSEEHTDVLTLAVFGMCNWGYQWFDPKGALKAEEIAEDYADLVIDAFSMRGEGR
jgi:AcrR family transcriptional regulator